MTQVFEKLDGNKKLSVSDFKKILTEYGTLVAVNTNGTININFANDASSSFYGNLSNLIENIIDDIQFSSIYLLDNKFFIIGLDSLDIYMLGINEIYDNTANLIYHKVNSIYNLSNLSLIHKNTRTCILAQGVYGCLNNSILLTTRDKSNAVEYLEPLVDSETTEGEELIARVYNSEDLYRISIPKKSRLEFKKVGNKLFLIVNTRMYGDIAKYSDALMCDTITKEHVAGYLIHTLITNVHVFMKDISDVSIDPIRISQLTTVEGIVTNNKLYILRPDGLYKFIDFTEDSFIRKTYIIPGVLKIAAEYGDVFEACPREGCYKLKLDDVPVREVEKVEDEVAAFDQSSANVNHEQKVEEQVNSCETKTANKLEQLENTVASLCDLLRDKGLQQEIESKMLSDVINNFHPTDLTPPEAIKSIVNKLSIAYLIAHVKQPIDNALSDTNKN